jgi:hypothetical protein
MRLDGIGPTNRIQEPSMPSLAQDIAQLQNQIVRELNDLHIFVRQALPLLEEAKSTHAASPHKKDRKYFVPSAKREKFAKRTDGELKAIFSSFTDRRLYESFLITAIAEFEGFLGKVLQKVLKKHPRKLGIASPGITPCRGASLEVIFTSKDLNGLLDRTIEEHLRGVFFATPRNYMGYFSKVAGADFGDPAILAYYEIKATRDLFVHSDRRANEIYLEKAGENARAKLGKPISVDSDYFDTSLATLKRISGIVKRDAEKSFRARPLLQLASEVIATEAAE